MENEQSGNDHPKLADLLSRINGGVINIPKTSDPGHVSERAADKVCIAIHLLRGRFGSTLERVPLSLLRFIAAVEFRYGVRSIEHLIDLIPYANGLTELRQARLNLPLGDPKALKASSLAYHLISADQALGIVKLWKDVSRDASTIAVFNERVDYLSRRVDRGIKFSPKDDWYLERLLADVQTVSD